MTKTEAMAKAPINTIIEAHFPQTPWHHCEGIQEMPWWLRLGYQTPQAVHYLGYIAYATDDYKAANNYFDQVADQEKYQEK